MSEISRRYLLNGSVAIAIGTAIPIKGVSQTSAASSKTFLKYQGLSVDFLKYVVGETAPLATLIRHGRAKTSDFQRTSSLLRLHGHHLRNSGYDDMIKYIASKKNPNEFPLAPQDRSQDMLNLLGKYDKSYSANDFKSRFRTREEVRKSLNYLAQNGVSDSFFCLASNLQEMSYQQVTTHTSQQVSATPNGNTISAVYVQNERGRSGKNYRSAILRSSDSQPHFRKVCKPQNAWQKVKAQWCAAHTQNGQFDFDTTPDFVSDLETESSAVCSAGMASGNINPINDPVGYAACESILIVTLIDQLLLTPAMTWLARQLAQTLWNANCQ